MNLIRLLNIKKIVMYTFYSFTIQLLLCTMLLASEKSNAQQTMSVKEVNISINFANDNLLAAFDKIERLSEFSFVFDKNDLDRQIRLSGKYNEDALYDVLLDISRKSGLTFKQVNNNINVQKQNAIADNSSDRIEIEISEDADISGTVTDESGLGLPGATVVVKGTELGTITDVDGKFNLSVPSDAVLTISFVGYVTKEITVGSQTVINVSMELDAEQLEEIVVIGYGTMKRSDLTGSVSTLSAEKIVDRPVVNVGQALQNKVAGVQVIKQGAGYPGSKPLIRIRGTNSITSNSDPLFVVDGIIGVNNALENINPSDILTLDVLKDASATAIYGTRGANGVIIITTKRGEAGDTKVSYSGSLTLGTMQRHNYTVTADQWMYQYEQAFRNTPKYGTLNTSKDYRGGEGTGDSWSEMPHLFEQVSKGSYFMDFVGNDGNYYKPRFYSDWEDEAFNNSFSQNHHIDVSGGGETAKFSLSVGHTDQEGLMLESYYKRTNVKLTGDIEINKWLGLSTSVMYSLGKNARGDDQTRAVSEAWPIIPTKYPNEPIYGIYAGTYATGRDIPVGEDWKGINYIMSQRDGFYRNEQFTGGLILNAQITDDLSFKTDISIDNRGQASRWYNGTFQTTRTSDARGSQNRWYYWQNQNYFDYNKTIGYNSISAMAGLAWSENKSDWIEARAYNFSSDFYGYSNLRAGSNTPRAYSSDQRSALNSYFARANYSYDGKYLLTLTGRYDGSSKFGENNKYGFFPSIGAAWNISNESFIAGGSTLSNLKLRASFGQTGNQEIGSFVTQTYISSTTVMFGDGLAAGLYPNSTGNPDLKWETTTQFDIGLDIGLFDNRVNVVFDAYHKLTDDMLFNLPLPNSTTPSSALVNYGSVKNTGVEVDISSRNMQSGNFSWDSRFTISANKNEIMELGPTGADVYNDTGAGNATSVYRVGESIGSFFGLNRQGVYSTQEAALAARYGRLPGDLKFEDVNQDGKIGLISDGDIIGRSYPKFYGAIINSFSYKSFDADITFQFLGGVDKAIVHESAEDRQFVSGMVNRTLNAWRPDYQVEGLMVAQIRAGNAGARYDSYSDTHQIYNAAFLRGSTASIGYSLYDQFGFNKIRVYANAENFFLRTAGELEGYDPEGSSLGKRRSNTQNIDKYQYPNPTNFSLGVNLTF